jgi:hypothetical protein
MKETNFVLRNVQDSEEEELLGVIGRLGRILTLPFHLRAKLVFSQVLVPSGSVDRTVAPLVSNKSTKGEAPTLEILRPRWKRANCRRALERLYI